MIIDSVRNFILTCPFLNESDDGKKINVNYLAESATVYSIEEVPCDPILKTYIGGDTVRQFQFIFASREEYGPDILQNITNSDFYEKFSDWIEEQNDIGNFPILDKKKPLEIKVMSPGYVLQVSVDKVRYQIELRLKYYKTKEN